MGDVIFIDIINRIDIAMMAATSSSSFIDVILSKDLSMLVMSGGSVRHKHRK